MGALLTMGHGPVRWRRRQAVGWPNGPSGDTAQARGGMARSTGTGEREAEEGEHDSDRRTSARGRRQVAGTGLADDGNG